MSKRKKKNIIILISLFMALIVMIIFYAWYINRDTKNNGQEDNAGEEITQNRTILATMEVSKIDYLHLINDEADIEFILVDEVWRDQSNLDRPINQNHVNNMISLISEITTSRVINENQENVEEYGLDEPLAKINARQTDGKTLNLCIGDEAVGVQGFYAMVNEDNMIYLLSNALGNGFIYTDNDMTAMEEAPVINADEIYHIEVIKRDGEDFELLFDPDNAYDYSSTGMFSWVILKPYSRPYIASGEKVTELQKNYNSFKFLSCVDYNCEDLTIYGLDNPIATINVGYYKTYTMSLEEPEINTETGEEITEKGYYDELNYKIHIGNLNEDMYYVMKDGSRDVYTMDAKDIETMLDIDAFDMMNSFVSIPNILSVDKIIAKIDGVSYTMEISRDNKINDDGEEEILEEYYYNGNLVTEDIFKDVYQIMISAKYDVKIMEDIDIEEVKPFFTLSYYLNDEVGSVLTASYISYDESFYIIQKPDENNEHHYFAADKREIDEIAAAIKGFNVVQ